MKHIYSVALFVAVFLLGVSFGQFVSQQPDLDWGWWSRNQEGLQRNVNYAAMAVACFFIATVLLDTLRRYLRDSRAIKLDRQQRANNTQRNRDNISRSSS